MKLWAAANLIALACSLQAFAQSTHRPGEEPVRPAAGVFLVAKSSIDAGPFHQSVVLLLSHGETGTLGVIVNRVTEVTFAEAFPGFSKKRKNEEAKPHALSFGGPVALNGLLYLFRSEDPPEKAAPVMKDVYFASDAEVLSELLELEMELANENRNKNGNEKESHSDADPDQRLRLFLGHAGWAPGQLDMEIRRGDWTLLPADPFTVFQKDPGRLWPELTTGGRVVAGLWH